MIRARLNQESEPLAQTGLSFAKANLSSGFSVTGIEISPLGDRWPIIQETVMRGNSLILVPSVKQAQLLVGRLKSIGVKCGLHGKDWLEHKGDHCRTDQRVCYH